MVCACGLFQWIEHDFKKMQKRKHRKYKQMMKGDALDSIENQNEKVIIVKEENRRSFINYIIIVWAYLEIIVLLFVLWTKNEDKNDKSLLFNGECRTPNIVSKAIGWKLLTTILLLIGSKKV